MYYKHVKERFKLTYAPVFYRFDGVLMVVDTERTDSANLIMANQHISFLEAETNFSWDGAVFWFNADLGQDFIEYAEKWFEKNYESLTDEMSDTGVSNILLYSYTQSGIAFVDTQRDMDSVIDTILNEFLELKSVNQDDMSTFFFYDDCHLIDNLCFGRDSNTHGNQVMYTLYNEGFLDESILFNSLYNNYEPNIGYSVALVGDFCMENHMIEDAIESCEALTLLDVPNKNTWVWIGDNVSKEDLTSLKANFKLVSHIEDVIEKIFQESFNY
jgi:hypothetical protein